MTRLYTDQVKQDLSTLPSSASDAWTTCVRTEHDTQFSYRLMEALRNHVQHHGLPVNQIIYARSWEGRGSEPMSVLRFGAQPHLDVQQLRENPKFKPSVLEELVSCTDPPNLTILVRRYVESFNRIHEAARQVLSQPTTEWTALFLSAFERSEAHLPNRQHVDLVRQDDQNNLVERVAIVRDLLKRISELRRRNSSLTTLARWYISNEVS